MDAQKRRTLRRFRQFAKYHGLEKHESGRFIMYKAVRDDFGSWYVERYPLRFPLEKRQGGVYALGTEVSCTEWDDDESNDCAAGLHVSTLEFARGFYCWDCPIIIRVLVDPRDVVCVPNGLWSNMTKKIRVKRLYVDGIADSLFSTASGLA